jgi:hypothetical protein
MVAQFTVPEMSTLPADGTSMRSGRNRQGWWEPRCAVDSFTPISADKFPWPVYRSDVGGADDVQSARRLECVECGRVSRGNERGWMARLTVDHEVVCTARSASSATGTGCLFYRASR